MGSQTLIQRKNIVTNTTLQLSPLSKIDPMKTFLYYKFHTDSNSKNNMLNSWVVEFISGEVQEMQLERNLGTSHRRDPMN